MTDMERLLSKLVNTADHYRGRVRALEREAARLNELPYFHGKPIYKDTHYLVLVPRMVDGERRLRYIGRDPDKIKAAMAEIARGDRLRAIETELADLQHAAAVFLLQLKQADCALSLKDSTSC